MIVELLHKLLDVVELRQRRQRRRRLLQRVRRVRSITPRRGFEVITGDRD